MTKQQQRREAEAARAALDPRERQAASQEICRQLLCLPELQGVSCVFSYRAMEQEADASMLHEWLQERGVRLAFPLCLPGGEMEARVPGGWKRGAYGIWEPDPALSPLLAPEEIQVALVPCVAFDRQNRRLGHGAGYYDRYLPRCPQALTVALAFEAQRLERLVCQPHDRIMDLVVTERGVYRK